MSERQRNKSFLFAGLSIFVIVVGTVSWLGWQKHMSQNIFSSAVRSSVSFTLFYPKSLPAGFTINKKSIEATQGQVVTYSASDSNGHHIIFSIQAKPSTFDFESFYSKSLSGTSRFSTDNGNAAIGKAQTGNVGSFVSDDTWVLITSDESSISTSNLQTVLKSLQPAS